MAKEREAMQNKKLPPQTRSRIQPSVRPNNQQTTPPGNPYVPPRTGTNFNNQPRGTPGTPGGSGSCGPGGCGPSWSGSQGSGGVFGNPSGTPEQQQKYQQNIMLGAAVLGIGGIVLGVLALIKANDAKK